MQESDIKYWVWLSIIPRMRYKKRIQLIEHFGSPKTLWEMSERDLIRELHMDISTVKMLMDSKHRDEIESHMEKIEKNGIQVISYKSLSYPEHLKNIHDPPLVIYMKGNNINNDKTVAVVGSRKASNYGLEMAATLSYELSRCGITVISGMARGVDTYAHTGALKAGGNTIAVLGCGVDIAYPIENKKLMEEIIHRGAVISEYLPGEKPFPAYFPARNRIISGMSLGVVVIEAGEKSGSLITADFALEQGREVFAVPGNITSHNSRGTNGLIREGAKIVTCIEDILEELNMMIVKGESRPSKNMMDNVDIRLGALSSEELGIVKTIENEALHIDIIAHKTGFSIQTVNSLLVMMELKGIIEQFPGKVYKLRSLI
ncbi:MAG: DNA-processing protein DprA [Clostridia bacterium]|nr:DNA-processing protein DprA [Clostridia bacterium]